MLTHNELEHIEKFFREFFIFESDFNKNYISNYILYEIVCGKKLIVNDIQINNGLDLNVISFLVKKPKPFQFVTKFFENTDITVHPDINSVIIKIIE